ncbi:dihydroxy-acid dehydratase, partial [Francisella tularensis subsp. holarctica]|uniref:dihydroxy-acid dehydratase domain-containing protein n=1 Tax=Francisella tularensis TaxID=263 RepID=UPI002381A02F
VMIMLLKAGILLGYCLSVSCNTLAENLENVADIPEDNTIIHKLDNPIKKTGHLQILKVKVATEGSLSKITCKEGEIFEVVAN